MEAKGVNGSVSFDGHTVVISRSGGAGKWLQGKGDKSIPASSVSAIQLQPPGLQGHGVWQVSLSGESAANVRHGFASSNKLMRDENTILFSPRAKKDFDAITQAIRDARAGGSPVPSAHPVDADREAVVGQLRQLGSMHHRRAIDDATFIREMHELLPRL